MTPRRRIWSELLPLEDVRSPRVLELLRRYGLELAVAVQPDTAAALPDLVLACADAGVEVAAWPMIADEDGRWAHAGNAAAFGAFVGRVLAGLAARRAVVREVVFDLEPPIAAVRGALAAAAGAARLVAAAAGEDLEGGGRAYAELAARLGGGGIAASAAAVPMVLVGHRAWPAWERALGTPVSAVAWEHVSVMLYTSMVEGWSRGLLRREDAVSLLGWGCLAARRRYGVRAGVSLGAVGPGALGDEPIYRGVRELREDVAIARAAGVERLALFDLAGVLARPPAEAWLDAFVGTPPAPAPLPAPTLRARGAVGVAMAAAAAVGAAVGAAAAVKAAVGGSPSRGPW